LGDLLSEIHRFAAVGVVAGFDGEACGLAVSGQEVLCHIGELAILEGVSREAKAAGVVRTGAGPRGIL
jgi:hypothetical protein